MTSPRASYGGAYYSAPPFPDTPIYDSLVAERGTPQIAPIRVPAAYDVPASYLPALPALPSPAGQHPQPSYGGGYGYPQQPAPQPAPLQQTPAPYIPQQQSAPRGYGYPQPVQQARPVAGGYEAMRPAAAPRPMATPAGYHDPYQRPQHAGY
ncbi:hypothetical protein C6N75_26700 [Streptomyces solincola]|uniref:Uncharacterized protein n=1 Tax=Streptomyces solincola TaxID=2100817 RepID=A0A2S9PPG0_9ACTN|nr:DUF6643 family protein [Streptomyces solincola]PRH76237.1 hypothetical protein C6N75_26700 [Streptomyces solincola]